MWICEETKTWVKTALLLGIGVAVILLFLDRPLVARLAALGVSACGVAEAVLSRQKTVDRAAICPFLFLISVLYSGTYEVALLPQGRIMLCAVVLICTINDIAAYFIGRHRLAPHISPHKTVEGALGGLCCAVGGGLLLLRIVCRILGWRVNFLLAAVLFAWIALTGRLGDLATSSLKRILGLKDFGRIFSGHGGVLDWFDSQLFAAPAAVLFTLLFGTIFLG